MQVNSNPRSTSLGVLCIVVLIGAMLGYAAHASRSHTAFSDFSERVWRIQDGMQGQIVHALAQTPDHYLWIGTERELLRFDGATFVSYTGNGVDALRHGVTSLMVARNGSMYVGTEGSGLLRYDHGHMEVLGEEKGLTNLFIRAIFQDAQGRIWVGSDSGIFQESNNRFVRVEQKRGCRAAGSTSFVQEASGDVLSGGNELIRFHGQSCTAIPMPSQNTALRILGLHLDRQGTLWVGTFGGLFEQGKDGRFRFERQVQGAARCFGTLPDGRMWVGTIGHGLYLRRAGGFEQTEAPDKLPSNTVFTGLEDAEGNLWIGTQSGLLRLSRGGVQLTELPKTVDADFASLLHDEDGSFWICSRQLFHTKNGELKPYRIAGLPKVQVRALLRDSKHYLWIGTAGMGVFRLSPRGKIEHYFSEVGNSFIRGFLEGRDGSIWIATEGGIARYAKGKTEHYRTGDGAPHSFVFSLAEDRSGALWVGTTRGLFLFRNGSYQPFPFSQTLQGHSVYALHFDDSGVLWVGADNGLFRVRVNTVFHFPLEGQNSFHTVYQILRDKGVLWIACPTHVFRWRLDELNAVANGSAVTPQSRQVFPISNELHSAEIQGGYLSEGFVDRDGSAWFASSLGLVHLLLGQRPAVHDVPLAMQRILVDGVDREARNPIILPPGTRSVEFDYAPVLLSAQDDLQLRQRLDGFDDWHTAPGSHSAIYTNLPPGKYLFRVKSINTGGDAERHELTVTLIQKARFYRQSWFWSLCAALLILGGWSVYQIRLQRMRIRFQAITSERTRIAREMHDTLLQECIGISSLLEAYTINNQSAERDTFIDYARKQVSSLIHEVRRVMLNLRATEHRQLNLEESMRKLVEQQSDSGAAIIRFSSCGKSVELDYRLGYEILMSTREALLNAIAHSHASSIELHIEQQPLQISISVHDNGVGFPLSESAAADGHFGLKGMHERMEGAGGTIAIESKLGEGTLVVLTIPASALHEAARTLREF